VCAR
ncbi:FMN-dependent dehydrogenase family protein, partial [Vibrio parahaemolyticus V-223/04]|jgi:hypothetical protein